MTLEGRSALQRLLVLVAGVYLCSLAISLLLSEPADYQRTCCWPARGHRVTGTGSRQPEVIPPDQTQEEVGKDDLEHGADHFPPFSTGVRRIVRIRRRKRKKLQSGGGGILKNKTKQDGVATPTSSKLAEYNMVLNPEYLCHQVDDDDATPGGAANRMTQVYLLIIVHSHPGHKRRRNAIRETWGRVVRDYDRPHQVAVVFALGLPRDYDEYKSVQKEGALYHDVVMWDFKDDYRNLTLKSLAGFRWAAEHCANTTYVMKADDDVYLNVPYLTDILTTYPKSSLILGSLNSDSPVKRYGQWKVDYEQFPADHFPPYCSGCAYIISADMTSRLHHVTQTDQSPAVLPVEDVYVTGLLAERLGVRCQHHSQFPTWITVPSVGLVQAFLRGRLVGLHGVDWIRMHSLWHMIRNCPTCSTDIRLAKRWLSWVMDRDPMYR